VIRLSAAALLAVLVGVAARIRRVTVAGDSMRPALRPGDRVIVMPTRRLRPGDVVALDHPRDPGRLLVKRVVAVDPHGRLTVIGDNSSASTDSRDFGPVNHRAVAGRAVYRYAPPGREGWLRRRPPDGHRHGPSGPTRRRTGARLGWSEAAVLGSPAMKELPDRWRELGEFIREQRASARLSLRRLSDLAGVSNPYLSQIERGLRRPSAEVLQQIAKALRISAETLYVRAGILEDREGAHDLVAAIRGDPGLTEDQKQTLIGVYRSFGHGNGAQGPGPGEPG
jgi:nickel-type superoxide dismutase maturation protease